MENLNSNEFRLYLFTVQSGMIKIDVPEDFKAVMARNDIDAVNKVKSEYPTDAIITARKRGEIPIQKIIDAVNVQTAIPSETSQKVKLEEVLPPTPQKTAEEFVRNMTLIADRFVTDKDDQMTLKRIIKKIKINDETKTPPTTPKNPS